MLLTSRTRRAAPGAHPHPLAAAPAHLPPGYTRAPSTAPHPAAPEPQVHPAAPAHPPTSGVLAQVHTECGCLATLHRAAYELRTPRGEFTRHGYAWRCPGCAHLTTGYLPETGFGRALRDAGAHSCEVHP